MLFSDYEYGINMPTKRNLKNHVLVEVIQPKDYMTLVNEKLDNNTKQLILNHISLMEIKEQAQETHKELMSWKNKLRLWYCGNCKPVYARMWKDTKSFEYLFRDISEKKAKEMLKDSREIANRKQTYYDIP